MNRLISAVLLAFAASLSLPALAGSHAGAAPMPKAEEPAKDKKAEPKKDEKKEDKKDDKKK